EEPSLHGFWIANINICTDDELDHCDPMYGSWPLRGLLCRVSKAPAPELLGAGADGTWVSHSPRGSASGS
ncbi:MAG: hypothetical protein Q8O86_04860, partial [Dehalococcoidia bacterium]|nr:hypothetical protein [Dehalococcoidia bacterium]